MPANQPGEIHALFQTAFNAHDLEALIALYEENAVFVAGGGSISGRAAISEELQAFFTLKPVIHVDTAPIVQNGDIALLEGRWVLTGATPDGSPVRLTGTSREVVRRQTDGTWLYVIDDPGTHSA